MTTDAPDFWSWLTGRKLPTTYAELNDLLHETWVAAAKYTEENGAESEILRADLDQANHLLGQMTEEVARLSKENATLRTIDSFSTTVGPPSRENEPPVGMWVKDAKGVVSYHLSKEGWGLPGFYPTGKWTAMWDAHGPYVYCPPWGTGEYPDHPIQTPYDF
jgi:hypothetical protein